jgi:hypothetical protein
MYLYSCTPQSHLIVVVPTRHDSFLRTALNHLMQELETTGQLGQTRADFIILFQGLHEVSYLVQQLHQPRRYVYSILVTISYL